MEKINSVVLALNLPEVAIIAAGSKVFIRDSSEDDGERITDDAFNRFVKLQVNIHYGGSGHTFCLTELRRTLLDEVHSDFHSVLEAAEHVTKVINKQHSLDWFNSGLKAEFLLMGNMVGTQDPIHIFRILRKQRKKYKYSCDEIGVDKYFIGAPKTTFENHWNKFNPDMDADEAFEVAFELIRDAAAPKGAGDIKLIMFDRRFSKTTVFTESSGYRTKFETRHEKDATSEVTRELVQIGDPEYI